MRESVTLECTECKRKNYTTEKNKKNTKEKIETKKYCSWCVRHCVHKEAK